MADVRRVRREAEKVAREALSGTLVDSAGALGVALAGRTEAARNVAAARAKATAIVEAAQAEGAALVATASTKTTPSPGSEAPQTRNDADGHTGPDDGEHVANVA